MFISSSIAIAVAVIAVAILVSLVIIVVNFIKNKDKANPITLRGLLRIYLYFMCLITLFIAVTGAAYLAKALLSYAVGFQFSYNVHESYIDSYDSGYSPSYSEEKIFDEDGKAYYGNTNERTQDIINGSTLFMALLFIFVIHRGALHLLEKREGETLSVFKKVYLFTSLTMYSLIGIIAIPVSIYQTINYFVYGFGDIYRSYESPGEALAVVIVVLPLWLAYLAQVLVNHKKEDNQIS
jgi:hypothetical protein